MSARLGPLAAWAALTLAIASWWCVWSGSPAELQVLTTAYARFTSLLPTAAGAAVVGLAALLILRRERWAVPAAVGATGLHVAWLTAAGVVAAVWLALAAAAAGVWLSREARAVPGLVLVHVAGVLGGLHFATTWPRYAAGLAPLLDVLRALKLLFL
jgi:uncharacterized membrane protein (Fun14 family)